MGVEEGIEVVVILMDIDKIRYYLRGGNDEWLRDEAMRIRLKIKGEEILERGLIEISNHCRNNCLYCGIRAGQHNVIRYRMSADEIVETAHNAGKQGFGTVVLQGGEDPAHSAEWVAGVVSRIRKNLPEIAITLSLGERSWEDYKLWKEAGANRYLLRHETATKKHYQMLHPSTMSFENRRRCLWDLKDLGYETGAGMMIGSPYQTEDDLINDLIFLEELQPDMIGVGPFIHAKGTPFESFSDGSFQMTLRLISILRICHPNANIPATTALAALRPDGRELGLRAGANVIMPNITPQKYRENYRLYNKKETSE